MIPAHIMERLQANWGDKSQSMACMAEVRYYDELSKWQLFILSVNPEDEDSFDGIVQTGHQDPEFLEWTLTGLKSLYNAEGEGPKIDEEWRPMQASQLWKKLGGGK